VKSGDWGGETRQEKKNKGRRADLRWLLLLVELLEATGSGAGGSRWFSFSSLLLLLLLFGLPPSPILSLLFFSPRLPCIYRQNKREREVGATTVLPPLHRPRDTSPPFSSTRGKL
jgi:hypothetical protein